MKKDIAVIYGGDSSEYQISIKSGKHVVSIIDTNKYNVYPVFYQNSDFKLDDGTNVLIDKNDFSFEINSEKTNFDCAIIVIHGTPGENGILESYFDLLKIPYTTCSPLVSALTFNKFYCNTYLKNFEIIISNNQKIKIIINTKLELGRFYSVKLGINEILKSNTDFTFLHNTDNPFVNQIILNKLFENKEDNFYNVPTFETQGGHPILISNTILKELQKYEDNSLLNKELSRFNKKKISTNDKNILININDLETYNLNTNIKNL